MADAQAIVVSPGVSLPISAANVSAGTFPGALYAFAGALSVAGPLVVGAPDPGGGGVLRVGGNSRFTSASGAAAQFA